MQGLITLDFGNTHPHAGLFQKTDGEFKLIKVVPLNELQIYLTQLGMDAHNTSVVICEVSAREEEVAKLQEQGFLVTRVKEYWRGGRFAGMPVHYTQTLGEDRLIEAFYLFKTYKKPTLIIDAGTFTTLDLVTPEGFLGGYIIPSTRTYFSGYQGGEQLREVPLSEESQPDLPQDTASAMARSYQAFAALAKEMIQKFQVEKVVITGGSATFWEDFFKQEAQGMIVESEPHLIHWALKFWMTTQIEPL